MAQLAGFAIRFIESFLYGAYASLVYVLVDDSLDRKSSVKEML